jgi:hypothetical protein
MEGQTGVASDHADAGASVGKGGVDPHHRHAPSPDPDEGLAQPIHSRHLGITGEPVQDRDGERGLAAGAAPGWRGDVEVRVQRAVEPFDDGAAEARDHDGDPGEHGDRHGQRAHGHRR